MILFCETCKEFFSEHRMASEAMCDICDARKETNDTISPKKEQGDKGLPLAGERGLKPEALVGQLTLEL